MRRATAIGLWTCLGMLYLTVLYFYIRPLGFGVLHWQGMDLAIAKDYYSILSSFITLMLGTAGLVVGYCYYAGKHKADQSLAAIERKRKRLDDLINKIDTYDSHVDNLLQGRFQNENELSLLRSKVTRSYETIEIMLDLNQTLLGLGKEDLRDIIKVNSFVEKNDLIMRATVGEMKQDLLHEEREKYIDLIQNADEPATERSAEHSR
jgi:hypothetical protein